MVVAAVVRRGPKIMMARRAAHCRHAGCWEFPGGKVEEGESSRQALCRELEEELSLTVEVGELLATVGNERITMQAFSARIVAGEPSLRDHDQLDWFLPQELGELQMTELDRKVILEL